MKIYKMNIYKIGLIIIFSIIGLISLQSYQKENSETSQHNKSKLAENPYNKLRNIAINMTLDQLELKSESTDEVYGIIMDWNMGNAVATVVAYKSGDASLYLSSGQVFIGGYAHETVVNASNEFIKLGNQNFTKAKKTDKDEPTKEDKVNFYFLTKSGRYYIEEDNAKINDNSSELIDLFYAGNQIITEYRTITEK